MLIAADGMPVVPLSLDPDAFMGAAIGHLAPGATYAVHFHYALEQLSFVVAGEVVVRMQAPGASEPAVHRLSAGQALTNPSGVTLSFANEAAEPAEVLFVCAPPFPPPSDQAVEVGLAGHHRPLTDEERAHAAQRSVWALDHFGRVAAQRLGQDAGDIGGPRPRIGRR